MLELLFTSRARVKLLELLVFNPGRKFHLREIARAISVSPPYVKKEIEGLLKLGVVEFEKKGNLSLFYSNKKSPIFENLKDIILKTEALDLLLRQQLDKLSGIKFAIIFGSFAKGIQAELSDIDLLIVGSVPEKGFLAAVNDFEAKTGRELNYIIWTEKEFRQKARTKNPLLLDIIKSKFLALKGNENEFRKAVKR